MPAAADPTASSASFPPDAVRACLERVVVSPHFVRSLRLTRFLRFTVEARLEGRAHELKERTIACEVYGRRLDYDPRCDPIVRSEAHRLRAKLEVYYAREGSSDPIAIAVPKGSYLPEFRRNGAGAHASLCRLAVAPFEDQSPRKKEPALTLGMGDALATRLAGRPGLRITYRSSRSSRARARSAPLEADFVLEGVFRRTGGRCLLSVRLLRMADREALWGDEFPFAWTRVAEVQEEIAERVAAAVGGFLARAGGPQPSVSPRAYELFLKAHHAVIQFANTRHREFLDPARRRLMSAVELEPSFSDALADLAFLELLQLNPPQAPPELLIERARAYLERALESDPRHVRSLYLLGDVHGNSGSARQGLDLSETAVALDPDDAEARTFLALRYASLGFYESALASCDEAVRLDPVWHAAHDARAFYSRHVDAFDAGAAALEEFHRGRVPSSLGEATLAGVLVAKGDLSGAERALERAAAKLSPEQDASFVEILRGLVAALQRDDATARGIFEAHRNSPPRIFDHQIRLALALGERESALDQIGASPYHRNYRWLAGEPLARPFLGEPGFRKLLEELHEGWLRDLVELGPRLPSAPPALPPPAQILAR
jgi:TolB-like protein/cytochrome c-type biogenesis protein CcmH/NrfG